MSDVQFPQVTGQAASDMIGFSPRWLSKLVDQGFVERKENNLFDLGEVLLGYIRFLKEADRRAARTAPSNAILEAKIRKLEIDNARALDALIEPDLAEHCANESMRVIREVFLKLEPLPGHPEIDAALRPYIEGCIERAERRFNTFFVDVRGRRPTGFEDDAEADPLDNQD